ncbi:MAG TPA: aquaporin [Sedimentisphaerales bacterium]|nr:aquaporin [Sedimentisphaerales bacterium]
MVLTIGVTLHINPAVAVGLWVDKQIEPDEALAYIIVQILGGIAAALLLVGIFGGTESGLGASRLNPEINVWQGLLIETILTFFLVNTIYNAAVSGKAKMAAGAAIGLALTFAIFFGGNLTGASLNPARTIGPDVVTGDFSDIWIYIVGPDWWIGRISGNDGRVVSRGQL